MANLIESYQNPDYWRCKRSSWGSFPLGCPCCNTGKGWKGSQRRQAPCLPTKRCIKPLSWTTLVPPRKVPVPKGTVQTHVKYHDQACRSRAQGTKWYPQERVFCASPPFLDQPTEHSSIAFTSFIPATVPDSRWFSEHGHLHSAPFLAWTAERDGTEAQRGCHLRPHLTRIPPSGRVLPWGVSQPGRAASPRGGDGHHWEPARSTEGWPSHPRARSPIYPRPLLTL